MELVKDIFVAACIYVHVGMSSVCIIGMLALSRAYRMPVGEPRGSAVWYFSTSVGDLAMAVGIANTTLGFWVWWRVYYSASPMMLSYGWPLICIGVIFDILFLRGLYRGLRAVQVSLYDRLPKEEWAMWPWWMAWSYPDRIAFTRRQ